MLKKKKRCPGRFLLTSIILLLLWLHPSIQSLYFCLNHTNFQFRLEFIAELDLLRPYKGIEFCISCILHL